MGSAGFVQKLTALTAHRHAEKALAGLCFAEASVIPAFPEVMLAPMIMADRRRAWRLAAICTMSSVAGGLLGYAIGMFLFELVGQPILNFYGLGTDFEALAVRFNEAGWIMVLIGALSPIPYKVITITSGVTGLDLWTFVLVGLLGRGLRYFVPCALFYAFGPAATDITRRHPRKVALAALALVVGGFAMAAFVI